MKPEVIRLIHDPPDMQEIALATECAQRRADVLGVPVEVARRDGSPLLELRPDGWYYAPGVGAALLRQVRFKPVAV